MIEKEEKHMTKEDNIFRMLNDMEIDHTEYEETELSDEEKDKVFETFKSEKTLSKPKRQNKTWIAVAAAVLLLIAGSQTSVGQQVQATAVSIIENIRYSLNSALGNTNTETPGALSFNQTAYIGNAEVSIQDLVAFDHRIVFNLLVDMDAPVQDEHFMGFEELEIQINGKTLNTDLVTSWGSAYDGEENIHSVVYSVPLDEKLSEEDMINISIQFEDIRYYRPGETSEAQLLIEGAATFSAETTREELNKYTDIYNIQTTIAQDDYEYTIEKMYINPVLNFIEIFSDDEDVMSVDFQMMEIRGTDEKGRNVLFEATNRMESDDYRKYSFSLTDEMSEISTQELVDAEYLDLQFYLFDWPEEQGGTAEFEPFGQPFKVELNN